MTFGDEVEVDKATIHVVDHFAFDRFLGEQLGTTAAERLGVERVPRDQRQDVPEHRLLASVVCYRGFHWILVCKVVFLSLSGINNKVHEHRLVDYCPRRGVRAPLSYSQT